MGQYVSARVAYGWVISNYKNDYATERLNDDIGYGANRWREFRDECEQKLKDEGVEATIQTFGYDFTGWAIVADVPDLQGEMFGWSCPVDALRPPPGAVTPQVNTELYAALEILDMSEAGLGEPQWLFLIGFG